MPISPTIIQSFLPQNVKYGLTGYYAISDNSNYGLNSSTSGADLNIFFAMGGSDDLKGFDGNDRLYSGGGADIIEGGGGDDIVSGDAGDDWLYGDYQYESSFAAGDDTLYGGSANDYLYGAGGDDRLIGGTVLQKCPPQSREAQRQRKYHANR